MAEQKQVIELDIEMLQANPLQPRGLVTKESIVDLAKSIEEHGILEPLVVAKTPAGYQLIAGERRWRAAKLAGLRTVPVIIKETTPQGMLEMAIVENVQREDLNAIDRAQSFIRLMEEFKLSNKEIADRIGKSPSFVSNSLRLLNLPDALKDGLLSNLITEGHARALAGIEDPKLMVEAYKMILRETGSVRRAEEIARRVKKKAGQPIKSTSNVPHLISDETDEIREDIHQFLGGDSKTKVKVTRSRVASRVLIVMSGNLEETEKKLQKIHEGLK